jgi:MFS family permease
MTDDTAGPNSMNTTRGRLAEAIASRRFQGGVLIAGAIISMALVALGAYAGRFNLDNVDGVSYISIARQYADGSFATAINAYWSPLISWLASLGIRAGLTGQEAIVIINTIAGGIGLAVGALFIWRRTEHAFFPTAIFIVVMGIFTAGNVDLLTPDMMVCTWVIAFVVIMIRLDERLAGASRRDQLLAGLAIGAFGVLGYLIKLFLVPVFVVGLLAWFALRFVRSRRRDGDADDRAMMGPFAVTLLSTAVALVLLATPWVAIISAKYDMFTVGSSFSVNLERKFDPDAILPVEPTTEIEAPPNDRAISFGEDRTAQATSSTASDPLGERLAFYVGQRLDAFPALILKIGTIAPFAVPLMCAVGVGFIGGFLSLRRHREVLMISTVWGVYFLGYAAITTLASGGGNSRYYWPLLALATMVTCLLIPWIWGRVRTQGWWRRAFVILLAFLVPFGAVWEHGLGRAGPFTQGPSPSGYLELLHSEKPIEQTLVEDNLVDTIPPGSRIMASNYRKGLKIAFYLDRVQIYGRAERGYVLTDPEFQATMRKADIGYYLQFTPATLTPPDLSTLGPVLNTFEFFGPCVDDATAIDEQCVVQVIKVTK